MCAFSDVIVLIVIELGEVDPHLLHVFVRGVKFSDSEKIKKAFIEDFSI